MKSRLIALSAISASFIALILTLGAYVEVLDIATIILASVFVLLPLYYKSYLGSFLSYLAGGLLAFIFSGFNIGSIVFPGYFALFGLYPIIHHVLKEKNVNKYFSFVIKFIWFVGVGIGLYFYYKAFYVIEIPEKFEFLREYLIYFYIGLLIIIYFLYDRGIKIIGKVIWYYLKKILK